ncbi:MAG: tRNA lysidine(34) synthetase TilS, partial [Candidatus Rokuibacteriota bacterium]
MDGDRGRAPLVETDLLAAVRAAISRHDLLRPGDRILAAVSGGPDSVALLHVLVCLRSEYHLEVGVCHVHHGLRPEADRDAAFVRGLAAQLGCPVTIEHVTVPRDAGRSLEEAARASRYAALERAARPFRATRIALGHTADDQAETVLMRVLQGAGPRGLSGMPIRRGRLIRPLLDVNRATVGAHLAAHGLPAVDDATNRDPKFLRNRIRHELLPLLVAQGWLRIGDALRRTARASRETVEALETLLAPRLAALLTGTPGGVTISLALLQGLPPGATKGLLRLAILRLASHGQLRGGLRAHHLTALARLLEAPAGARVRLPGALIVERTREALWITTSAPLPAAVPLAMPGETRLWAGLRLIADARSPGEAGPPDPTREVRFDAGGLPATIEVRPWRSGDRIMPFGGEQPIRVTRLLAAAGAARSARSRWPLLVGRGPSGEEVLWVIGVRRGGAAPMRPDTRTMLRIRAIADPLPVQK